MSGTSTNSTHVGWVSGPDTRGTTGLLWSCLFTIFTCTWSALHINIPARSDSEWKKFGSKFKWMAAGVVAPEYITVIAMRERVVVKSLRKSLNGVESGETRISLVMAHFIAMGGFELVPKDNEQHRTRLSEGTFRSALDAKFLTMPKFSDEDILDRSKADWLLKFISIVQIVWLIAQIIGRSIQHLSITTIELFAAGIVGCTILNYWLWWSKPLDVMRSIAIEVNFTVKELDKKLGRECDKVAFNNFPALTDKDYLLPVLSTLILGLCHLCAWNFLFPSFEELILWRIASICVVVFPLLAVLLAASPKRNRNKGAALSGVFIMAYCLLRAYLLVEAFVGLRSVPEDVYQDIDWNKFIPHV